MVTDKHNIGMSNKATEKRGELIKILREEINGLHT